MSDDINLLIKPRNARILRIMRLQGWETVGAMCTALGRGATNVGCLVNMTKSPLNAKSGEWTFRAKQLAKDLHVEPEDLWPEHMRKIVARKSSAEIEVSLDQAIAISSGHDSPSYLLENKKVVDVLLTALTPRERAAIKMRMLGGTLEEGARVYSVTRERFRQIEQKAYRKIKRAALVKFGAKCTRDLIEVEV